jgi:hypothetical protein
MTAERDVLRFDPGALVSVLGSAGVPTTMLSPSKMPLPNDQSVNRGRAKTSVGAVP